MHLHRTACASPSCPLTPCPSHPPPPLTTTMTARRRERKRTPKRRKRWTERTTTKKRRTTMKVCSGPVLNLSLHRFQELYIPGRAPE